MICPTPSTTQCYGFADDFKVLSLNQFQLQDRATNLEAWCGGNQMYLNASKCKLVNFKRKVEATLNTKQIESVNCQRDLGLLITPGLSWNEIEKQERKTPLESSFNSN